MKTQIFLTVSLFALFSIGTIAEAKLPDYITPCSRSDPNLNECALRVGRASMKRFSQGDKERGIPPLEPLTIKELRAIGSRKGDGLSVIFTNCKLIGCGSLDLKKLKFDQKNKKIIGKAVGDLVIDSLYDISGRILIIPLTGHGNALVNLRDVKLTYTIDYEFVKRNGKEYIQIANDNLKYDIGKASFKLDNLFNGDKVLGESTNRLLNDSWKDVISEVGPSVAKVLKDAFRDTIQQFLSTVPFDELLLP